MSKKASKYLIRKLQFGWWQLCPKCNGSGMIEAWPMRTAIFETCDVCNGNKIIMRPLLNRDQNVQASVATDDDSSTKAD